MRIFLLSIIIISFNCCDHSSKFKYDYYKLEKAWDKNDSLYLKDWVKNLEGLDFVSFVNRTSEFATTTNFCFGYLDTEGDVDRRWSRDQKSSIKYNVYMVNLMYLQSCIFLNKKIPFDSTLYIQEKYWNDSTLFKADDLRMIKAEFENTCNRFAR